MAYCSNDLYREHNNYNSYKLVNYILTAWSLSGKSESNFLSSAAFRTSFFSDSSSWLLLDNLTFCMICRRMAPILALEWEARSNVSVGCWTLDVYSTTKTILWPHAALQWRKEKTSEKNKLPCIHTFHEVAFFFPPDTVHHTPWNIASRGTGTTLAWLAGERKRDGKLNTQNIPTATPRCWSLFVKQWTLCLFRPQFL